MSPRVLAVDDEQQIARNLQAFLEDEGLWVSPAHCGDEALALRRPGTVFDGCIVDPRLLGMDGNVSILALHEICPTLRFVLHTGSFNYNIPQELRWLGIGEIERFRKPVPSVTMLATRVRSLVAG
jgi:DNA-binding NtrC family response regulator